MSHGNQRTIPNSTSNNPNSALASPVTPQELAYYLGMDYDVAEDDILNLHLVAACEWYIAHSNNELLTRQWTLKLDRSPADGDSYSGLSPIYANLKGWIDIPLTPVSSIESVTVDGLAVTYSEDLSNKPPRVFLDSYAKDIVIEYTAGHTLADDIPKSAMLGITMLAAYLYEHRGACEIGDAAKKSGACGMWGINTMILSL